MIPEGFTEFFRLHERPVRYALCAEAGFEVGREATAEAFAYAWENWGRISEMANPAGYVYRVGQRRSWRLRRALRQPALVVLSPASEPMFEPGLSRALAALSGRQRAAIVLVHGLGFSFREAAGLLGVAPSTVQKHVERALASLRNELGVA